MPTLQLEPRIAERFFDCVHCGLCLAQCPTYSELGNENDSPRGRIYLMRRLSEGRLAASDRVLSHLGLCLDCRACETACPSGVRYGSLIESMRGLLAGDPAHADRKTWADRVLDRFMYQVFPHPQKLRWWLWLARLGQSIGLNDFLRTSGLIDAMPVSLAKMEAMLPPDIATCEPLPEHALPDGPVRARVAMFRGCVSESIFGPSNRAMLRVLLANGCEVFIPDAQVCCGAIHHHGGKHQEAEAMARRNIDTFLGLGPIDAVVTNVAGCGTMLKEYTELLHHDPACAERARQFVSKMMDISEFLADLPLVPPPHEVRARVTYHEACHLCHGQQIRNQPRKLLRSIPGLELVEMPESDWCCGAAGTYNLTQPEMSTRLAERKLANADKTKAEIIATGNAGCLMQLMQHVRATDRPYRVMHPIDLLDRAYSGHVNGDSV